MFYYLVEYSKQSSELKAKALASRISTTMMFGLLGFALCNFLIPIQPEQSLQKLNTNDHTIMAHPISLRDLESMNYGEQKLIVEIQLNEHIDTIKNPEELGSYFEGDIVLSSILQRNGLVSLIKKWNNGVIPIELRGFFSPNELKILNTAFEMFHNYTCIKFIRYSSENDYVTITNKQTGCWSSVGRIGRQQILNLQTPMCMYRVGTTVHELMHVLGFYHEQSREDRDEYVKINWKNIATGSHVNFMKVPPKTTDTFNVKYDYESILHYSPYAFALEPLKPSITPLNKSKAKRMGQREQLSKSDIEKIWKMYKCTKVTGLHENAIYN